MKIVCVGGCGFVGHNFAAAASVDHDVTVIDSLSVNNKYSLMQDPDAGMYLRVIDERLGVLDAAGVPLICMDARDYDMLSRTMSALKPDVIICLAAVAHLDRANKDPYSTFGHSLRTLENSLDIARNLPNQPHFIYFSSSTIYGHWPDGVGAITEPNIGTVLSREVGIYGAVKRACEDIVNSYHLTYGMDTTIVRPSALYGRRCVSGRVTQKFVEQAVAGKPLTVFGDGSLMSDFTCIDDLVQGLKLIIEKRAVAAGQTFNITAGHGRTLKELARIIANQTGVDIVYGPADPERPRRGSLCVDNAKKLLGYTPKFTLEGGMRQYIGWYEAFLDRYKREAA